ncbi:MAG: helix-turn-helix domain-containing protein [Clostridia bacterium]|nr:helix-turn-helix domain-containing protein [Clostridia bacterium]
MIVQNILLANESYTYQNWFHKDICVGFSRLYYIIDGEAYYEEDGRRIRLKKGHLYLTPVKSPFTLSENPSDKLLHTYVHITTLPEVKELIEIPVQEGTPLADGVALWRKYVHSGDMELLLSVIQFILARVAHLTYNRDPVAVRIKEYIDNLTDFVFDGEALCRALGYTREHITRRFSEVYHATPKQYFNRRRMEYALAALEGGAKIAALAEALHFSSPYAFSKAFKQYFGLSPLKFRGILPHIPPK